MNKIKRYIGIVLTIIILIIVAILVIGLNKNNKEITTENIYDEPRQSQEVSKTTDFNMYYTIENCIKTYLTEINLNDAQMAIALLNEEYILKNGINEENVFENIERFENYNFYKTIEMYQYKTDDITNYFVKTKIDGTYAIFKIREDSTNKTFDITPIDEELYTSLINNELNLEEYTDKEIEKNTYNVIIYRNLDDGTVAKWYYDDFLSLMISDVEEAYNTLDEEYKEKRFENIDGLKEFINENKEILELTYKVETAEREDFESYSEFYNFTESNQNLGVKNYLKNDYDNYIQYVCADIYENYYYFNVKTPGDYTVILDSHTVDVPAFTEKYETASNNLKMGMNIEKFFDAINTKDYKYAYNVLADSFKTNNYTTQQDFEDFIKQNLFQYNEIKYEQFSEQGNVYLYKIIVKDKTDEENTKEMTIVMQLLEGTDFVMSFSFE